MFRTAAADPEWSEGVPAFPTVAPGAYKKIFLSLVVIFLDFFRLIFVSRN